MNNISDLRDGIIEILCMNTHISGSDADYIAKVISKFINENLKMKVKCPKMNHFDTTDKHDVEWFKGCPDCKGTLYIEKSLKEWWGEGEKYKSS